MVLKVHLFQRKKCGNERGKIESSSENISSDKLAAPYFRLVGQTVQSRQLWQLGEAAVVDAEVQVLVQDAEILIAALHNPTAPLQINH